MSATRRQIPWLLLIAAGASTACSLIVDPKGGRPAELEGWTRRAPIVLDVPSSYGEMEDFPLAVSVALGTEMADDGHDLRFTDADGTLLAHELERVPDAEAVVAWVSVPLLAPGIGPLWMYYGNADADDAQQPDRVWDSAFLGVWHLGEQGAGNADDFADSTWHGNHARAIAGGDGLPQATPAKLGGGQHLQLDSYLNAAAPTALDVTSNAITLEAWVYFDTPPIDDLFGVISKGGHNDGYRMLITERQAVQFQLTGLSYSLSTGQDAAPAGYWLYLVASYDGQVMNIYVDGNEAGALGRQGPVESSPSAVLLGRGEAGQYNMDGFIDEVRISDVTRSEQWIKLQHASMLGSLAVIDFGLEEAL